MELMSSDDVHQSLGEVWADVPGFPDYQVSTNGRVYSKPRTDNLGRPVGGKILRWADNGNGYPFVALRHDGKKKLLLVHRIVLTTFVGPCPDGMEGCHNDGNRMNPSLSNLRWDTRSANHADKRAHGTQPYANHTHCTFGHPLSGSNLKPNAGRRRCLACARARSAAASRGEAITKELADSYYAEIAFPGSESVKRKHPQRDKTHCVNGHELKRPNLVEAGLRAGIRQCRACANGRQRAKRMSVPFTVDMADDAYRKIMG